MINIPMWFLHHLLASSEPATPAGPLSHRNPNNRLLPAGLRGGGGAGLGDDAVHTSRDDGLRCRNGQQRGHWYSGTWSGCTATAPLLLCNSERTSSLHQRVKGRTVGISLKGSILCKTECPLWHACPFHCKSFPGDINRSLLTKVHWTETARRACFTMVPHHTLRHEYMTVKSGAPPRASYQPQNSLDTSARNSWYLGSYTVQRTYTVPPQPRRHYRLTSGNRCHRITAIWAAGQGSPESSGLAAAAPRRRPRSPCPSFPPERCPALRFSVRPREPGESAGSQALPTMWWPITPCSVAKLE